MKYFAKHLPFRGGYRRIVKHDGIPVDDEQEVRLMLCSRDVEIDDVWNLEDGDGVIGSNTRKNDGIWSQIMQKNAYKIIGEINPLLTDIKEGDEWTDETLPDNILNF